MASQSGSKLFPFLLGGTFIEAHTKVTTQGHILIDFPSFWEGLSLRRRRVIVYSSPLYIFPFLLGGTFIEAAALVMVRDHALISLPFGRDFH